VNDDNLRSGNPGETNSVRVGLVMQSAQHTVFSVSFSYRYVSGYGPAGRERGTNFTVFLTRVCSGTKIPIYSSPDLVDYPFDVCSYCYSPPVSVHVPGMHLDVKEATELEFVFQNNDRNVQLLLPIDFTIGWD
jgi:hypothetical protein